MPDDIHFYEPAHGHGLPHDPFNAIVGPRPIGWISSQNAEGHLNLAPYSFFNAFNYIPPIVGFSSVGRKDSLNNIEQTGEFAWNLATRPLAEQMNQSCAMVGPEVNEFELAGLTTVASKVTGLERTRGGLTSRDGVASNPARSNSSTSGGTMAHEAFIASAKGRVARFQTNSPVSRILRAVSFRLVDEKPMIGGV